MAIAIHVCVVHGGELVGVVAVLDREHALRNQAQVDLVQVLTPPLVPALLSLRGG